MMKTTIERLADDKLRLDVEVPEQMVQEALDHTLEMMGREINLPGFRPGKVPAQAVLARVGREGASAEAVRHHMDDWYHSAVIASGIRPVASPEIDFDDNAGATFGEKPFAFSAIVEVAPKPKLPNLKKVEVDRPKLPDLKPYMERVLDATLRGAGELKATGEPAKNGDEVVVDFSCTVEGEQITGASATGYEAALGDGRLLTELEAEIIGKSAGTEMDIAVSFPAEHPMSQLAGQHATFHVNLREVLRVDMPELTDEVAKKVSEFDKAKDLKKDIEQRITDRLTAEIDSVFRGNAVAKLAEVVEFTPPESMVERRQQELYMGLKQQLAQHGASIEAYLDQTGTDQNKLLEELSDSARDDVRRELCILALAEDQQIAITEDDLREEVRTHLEESGEAGPEAEEAMERIIRSGRADMLRGELLVQRTIDYLVSQVKPVAVDPLKADPEEEI